MRINRNHNKTSHKRRPCLWCAANLEALSISVLCWSQQFWSCKISPWSAQWFSPSLTRGAKARTSPPVSLPRVGAGASWLPLAGLVSLPCTVLGNKTIPAWAHGLTKPPSRAESQLPSPESTSLLRWPSLNPYPVLHCNSLPRRAIQG